MSVSSRQKQRLKIMGIPVWRARRAIAGEKKSLSNSDDDWQNLKDTVSICQLCELSKTRTNAVFGVGNPNADLIIIGEAPGYDEDLKGEPFLGDAGKLLSQMIFSIGLSREAVFIANILKCHPTDSRNPKPDEIITCAPFLEKQINHIKPKVILSVGAVSTKNLLNSKQRISDLRGQQFAYGESSIPLIATYHPAYLLRSPKAKAKTWSDLILVKRILLS